LNISSVYTASNSKSAKLDINKATVKQLMTVKGIGQAKAKAIVKFIEKEKVKAMDNLLKVKGVGKKVLKSIEEKFEVKSKSKPPKKSKKKK
jgi:competence protein ComEA